MSQLVEQAMPTQGTNQQPTQIQKNTSTSIAIALEFTVTTSRKT